MPERRWARVYYDDLKRDYPDVWRDNDALASWLRLLVIAEVAWPSEPELPRSINHRILSKLVDAGLIATGPDYTFAVRGHNAERSDRNASALAGANARWNANAHANASASAMPKRELDETKRGTPPPQEGKRANGTNPRATGTNPRSQGTSIRQEREAQKRGPSSLHEILKRVSDGA